jgi:hypothetical protein
MVVFRGDSYEASVYVTLGNSSNNLTPLRFSVAQLYEALSAFILMWQLIGIQERTLKSLAFISMRRSVTKA